MGRGFSLFYKVRKTTSNNKSGDNYSITIPRFIAKQFEGVLFKLEVSGNCFIFKSGCEVYDEKKAQTHFIGGAPIAFN